MAKSPLQGLAIRTAVVVQPDGGRIYACDLKKEEDGIPHTYIVRWRAGEFTRFEADFDIHTACIVTDPDYGVLVASEPGYYSLETKRGVTDGDIFENSTPPAKKRRIGGIRSVSAIDGKAYAVGIRGMIYRMDEAKKWARIDDGLPESFNAQAVHGVSESDIHAVGQKGHVWRYNGKKWTQIDLPTNKNLTAVCCAADDNVYAAGHDGILIRGRKSKWEIIEHEGTEEDIWDLEWFDDRLYASTLQDVFELAGDKLEVVNWGKDVPRSCYQLTAAKGVMWSNGEYDIMSFDGSKWSRVV